MGRRMRAGLRLGALLGGLLALATTAAVPASAKPVLPAGDEDETMAAAADPVAHETMRTAVQDAQSDEAGAIAALGRKLRDPGFRERLDDEEAYGGPYEKLRLARVLRTLSENDHPAAREVLIALVEDRDFVNDGARASLMIDALIPLRPAPAQAIAYWKSLSAPGGVFRHSVIDALAANGSAPALDLLRGHFLDPGHSEEEKVLWMRDAVLRHRADLGMLELSEALLRGGLPAPLQHDLVVALFDYRPEQWYLDCEAPEPPAPSLDAAVRAKRHELGRFALANVELDDRTRARIESELGGS